ncbi:MAG TPA: RNA polymerase sigma factor [Bacteroidota bacterium]|nr:RNA polymerase sigma factor [Bacteroidota bacterium]
MVKAQNGSHDAFEELYRIHVGRVYALCLRLSRETSRAEELTQDVFVRAWQMLHTFRGESAFSSWLHRLAVNVVLTDIRSARRRTTRVSLADDETLEDFELSVTPPGTGVDLERAIGELPTQARAVFVLHDIEGYRHEEIGKLMSIAVGTSKAQLHRARKLLKEMLR